MTDLHIVIFLHYVLRIIIICVAVCFQSVDGSSHCFVGSVTVLNRTVVETNVL